MHWFKDVAWNDLALAAVACISPFGVWLPFWFEHRQKVRDRHQRQLGELQRLRDRIQRDIRPWANEWSENSYDPHWYDPSWQVLPFDAKHLEDFNRVVMAGDYPQELTTKLVKLESAARRFHEALGRHEQFRAGVSQIAAWHYHAVLGEASKRTAALSDQDIEKHTPAFNEEDRRWLQNLYQSFRNLHVETIGGRDQDGLYEAWRSVVEQMDKVQAAIQSSRDTRWYWVGHVSAGLLAVTGILFLFDFWWTFVGDRFCPTPSTGPAPAHAPVSPVGPAPQSAPTAPPPPAPGDR